MAWEFQLKLCLGLPGSMSLFESHPLSGPQFPLVCNGEIDLDLWGLIQSQSEACREEHEYTGLG